MGRLSILRKQLTGLNPMHDVTVDQLLPEDVYGCSFSLQIEASRAEIRDTTIFSVYRRSKYHLLARAKHLGGHLSLA